MLLSSCDANDPMLHAVRENMHASEADKLPDDELIAQVSCVYNLTAPLTGS